MHIFDRRVLGITRPSKTFRDWYHQHLRWMRGFHQLGLFEKLPVFGNLLLLPVAAGFYISDSAGNLPACILLLVWFFRLSFLAGSLFRLGKSALIPLLPLYEMLYPPVYISILLISAVYKNISWKSRRY